MRTSIAAGYWLPKTNFPVTGKDFLSGRFKDTRPAPVRVCALLGAGLLAEAQFDTWNNKAMQVNRVEYGRSETVMKEFDATHHIA